MTTIKATGLAAFALASVVATSALAANAESDQVARGKYLTTAADCAACHTDPKGGKPFAGGYPIASPMGDIIATNITPSKEYGIGNWSEEQFARAIQKGVAPHGVHLYPAMPYPSYAKLTDDDVAAIYAYIQSDVKPVDEAPSKTTNLAFPFNVRVLMAGWNLMFSPTPGWTPPAGLDETEQRGAYLVQGLEHCSTCHTPRGLMMNSKNSEFLGGASLGVWRAPNITPDVKTGIGDWSKAEIVEYLKDGHAPGRAAAAGPMAEAIDHSLHYLTSDDLNAIAAYLKKVPAVSDPVDAPIGTGKAQRVSITSYETMDWTGKPDDLADYSTTKGVTLYTAACAACHGVDGKGAKDGHFPDLTKASAVTSSDPRNFVMTIEDGVHRHDGTGYTVMPGFDLDLNNAQVASLVNYVSDTFTGSDRKITADDVTTIRKGGTAPWLVKNAAWLTWVGLVIGLIIVIAIIVGILRAFRRKA